MILPHNPFFDADPGCTTFPSSNITSDILVIPRAATPRPISLWYFLPSSEYPKTRGNPLDPRRRALYRRDNHLDQFKPEFVSVSEEFSTAASTYLSGAVLRSSRKYDESWEAENRTRQPRSLSRSRNICVRRKGHNRRAQTSSTPGRSPCHL